MLCWMRLESIRKGRKRVSRVILILLLLTLKGCVVIGYEKRTPFEYVEIYDFSDNEYFLRIPYKYEGRGNLHNPFDYDKREYESSEWIILPIGEQNEQMEIDTNMSACPYESSLYGQTSVKGTIKVNSDRLIINIKLLDGVDSNDIPLWKKSDFSGEYRLYKKGKIQPNILPDFCESKL